MLFRDAAVAIAEHVPDALQPQELEWLYAEQLLADPPLPLFRTALGVFFSIRNDAPMDEAAYALEVEPLRLLIEEMIRRILERRAASSPSAEAVETPEVNAVACAPLMGLVIVSQYVTFRAKVTHRPKDPVRWTFHREVVRLFKREKLGEPRAVDLACLWRAFDPSEEHEDMVKVWTDHRGGLKKKTRSSDTPEKTEEVSSLDSAEPTATASSQAGGTQ